MTLDVDVDVAVKAIKLTTLLYKYVHKQLNVYLKEIILCVVVINSLFFLFVYKYYLSVRYDVLEEEDCSQVEQLVFCDQRRIAHAAGEFLALRIIRLSLAASPKKIKGIVMLFHFVYLQ